MTPTQKTTENCKECAGKGWVLDDVELHTKNHWIKRDCPVCKEKQFSSHAVGKIMSDLEGKAYYKSTPTETWIYVRLKDFEQSLNNYFKNQNKEYDKLKKIFSELGKMVFPNDDRAEDIDLVVRNIKTMKRMGEKAIGKLMKNGL